MTLARDGGSLVSQVHQVSGRVFSRVLKKHGIEDLNPAQGRILFVLWQHDGITQTELAERTKLDKSTLTIMLDRLVEDGQVERVRDESDARKRLIRTTKKNRSLHGAYAKASDEMTELYYRGISDTEIDRFERTLGKILANLEEASRS
jgi:MarR family transcriptional regulator, organic hydroperoxide resistance regulator